MGGIKMRLKVRKYRVRAPQAATTTEFCIDEMLFGREAAFRAHLSRDTLANLSTL